MQNTKEPLFNIYTAIDIMDGRCVRLHKGDFGASTIYNNDPIFVAKRWQNLGAKFLHIVDLDGARVGRPVNAGLIRQIISELKINVQVGGGIRSLRSIEKLIEVGVTRVIIGSAAVTDPDFVNEALRKFGSKRIVLGIDCKDNQVAISGWLEKSEIDAAELVNEFKPKGLQLVHYTDISRDGTLNGPNIDGLRDFIERAKINTISSGGIASLEDVLALKELNKQGYLVDGVIIGKALYASRIKPKELYSDNIYF
jgi:phosphoribosylformimino-5-aminoimidazole carboxamide ribotide isomerase